MTKTTKTIGPLHFEDLEPHRFEDLGRQLIYDLKNWHSLEATGRTGADEGFDARGWEFMGSDEDEEGDLEETTKPHPKTRLWQIQCKREANIGPEKMSNYMDEILKGKTEKIHGVIFIARTDFSKKTRDKFLEKLREYKVQEGILWGKGELEDQLFQPKNDHLLFAYFGISLVMKAKSNKSKIRSNLSAKRKCLKYLGPIESEFGENFLIRNADDKEYPYTGEYKDFKKNPQWKEVTFGGHYHNGIFIILRKRYAYVGDDGEKWDYIKGIKTGNTAEDDVESNQDLEHRAWRYWLSLEQKNRAWFEVRVCIKYEDIIEIDPEGDTINKMPHVYLQFKDGEIPYDESFGEMKLSRMNYMPTIYHPKERNRIKFFPKEIPEVKVKELGEE